eukprot:scaffold63545_cov58-Attheya_sp.AAC.3
MSTDPDVVEFELRFRAPNVRTQLGISVYQGVEETAAAPEFFRMFLNGLHRNNTETSSTTWRFSGDVTMKDLRAFYQEINKPDNPEVVGKVFKSDNDERRDLIGRNVPQHMPTVTQGQNMFYFLRLVVLCWSGRRMVKKTKSLITVDDQRTMVYDHRGLHICYSHKFIEKLHSASVKGRRIYNRNRNRRKSGKKVTKQTYKTLDVEMIGNNKDDDDEEDNEEDDEGDYESQQDITNNEHSTSKKRRSHIKDAADKLISSSSFSEDDTSKIAKAIGKKGTARKTRVVKNGDRKKRQGLLMTH